MYFNAQNVKISQEKLQPPNNAFGFYDVETHMVQMSYGISKPNTFGTSSKCLPKRGIRLEEEDKWKFCEYCPKVVRKFVIIFRRFPRKMEDV